MAQIIGTEPVGLYYAAEGIGVDCVCPGPTDTPMVNVTSEEPRSRMAQRLPPKRMGDPENVGEVG